MSLWHSDTDTFEHGQWFKGRVYERRCDLSADGSLFVYFARKSTSRAPADSWVAISRPPWFAALALWFVGGTYYTGGFFPDRRSLWLGFGASPPDEGRLPRWLTLTASAPPYIDGTNNWTSRTVYINRLLRDGWVRVPRAPAETWERGHPHRQLTLIMTHAGFDFRAYGGPYAMEYAVRTEPQGETVPLWRATWADWDQRGRLVHRQPAGTLEEIVDFNEQIPEPGPAPASARSWPKHPAHAR